MHILTLCHEYPPVGGGAAAVAAALAEVYLAEGHTVTLMTMAYGDLPAAERRQGVDVVRVNCGRRRREMASPVEGLRWAQRTWSVMRDLHRARPFDVVHAHFIMPAGILAARLRREASVPFIVTPHGSDVPGYNRERLKLAHLLVKPWWRRICHQAYRIASPSQSLLDLAKRQAGPVAGMVIPNGFTPGRFAPRLKERRILLCSRLVERKGFHDFLAAIGDLDLPGWAVDIVGDGPMFQRLERLAAACRTPVRLHGWIDNDAPILADLYGRASIFVLPSEWENFSIALLEAMSAGCAVVTTDVSGNPEVVGDTGVLVPPRSLAGLRDAVASLARDPQRCQGLGERAKARAESLFAWPAIGRRYLDVLNSARTSGVGQP